MLGWIEDGHEITYFTIFGAITNEKERILSREHGQAMRRLGVAALTLGLSDDAHGPNIERFDEIDAKVRAVVSRGWDVTVWPTGIHHPDHGLVACIGAGIGGCRRWFYDELPYYVLYPNLGINPDEDDRPNYGYERLGSRSFLEEKRRLVHCYASQIGETEERCLFVPERVWEVK